MTSNIPNSPYYVAILRIAVQAYQEGHHIHATSVLEFVVCSAGMNSQYRYRIYEVSNATTNIEIKFRFILSARQPLVEHSS